MKNCFISTSFMGLFFLYLGLLSNTSGGPAQTTGAPSEATCGRTGCHAVLENQGAATIDINFNEGDTSYVTEEIYPLTISLSNLQNDSKNGFQIVALDSVNNNIGSWILTDETATQIRAGNSLSDRSYVTHTRDGVGQTVWNFSWQAPSVLSGDITFYLSVNDSDNNGGRTGDDIYITNFTIEEDSNTTNTKDIISSSIQVFPNPTDGQLFFTSSALPIDKVELYNPFGALLLSSVQTNYIDLSNFSAGVYYLSLTTPSGKGTKKIILGMRK